MFSFYYAEQVCSVMGLLAIVSSLLVIGQAVHNPVNAVLWLIVAFVAVACYLITAGMTFLGLSYIIVYVGAIAVLFLFVVMMLNLASQSLAETPTLRSGPSNTWPIAIIIAVTGFLSMLPLSGALSLVTETPLSLLDAIHSGLYTPQEVFFGDNGVAGEWVTPLPLNLISPMSQVQMLGLTLYTNGALWLLLISVLLMLAMIVPLALAFTPLFSGGPKSPLMDRQSPFR